MKIIKGVIAIIDPHFLCADTAECDHLPHRARWHQPLIVLDGVFNLQSTNFGNY
ncbi:MAG: hypothetical protein VX901_07400 [Candidatus Poribacteria bacterium]|nr:hypothetical protein [Candidatus Poribacteria bacterium]